jgi:hypothetical protein
VRVSFRLKLTASNAPRLRGRELNLEALFEGNCNGRLAIDDCMFAEKNAFGGGTRLLYSRFNPHGANTGLAFIFLLTGRGISVGF